MAHVAITPQKREIFAEYLAGATYLELRNRHGLSQSTLYFLFKALSGGNHAAISRRSREEANQSRIAAIAKRVGMAWPMKPGAVWTDSRKAEIVRARQAVFLIAQEAGVPVNAIGRAFELDHTTVLHGIRQAKALEEKLAGYEEMLDRARAGTSA